MFRIVSSSFVPASRGFVVSAFTLAVGLGFVMLSPGLQKDYEKQADITSRDYGLDRKSRIAGSPHAMRCYDRQHIRFISEAVVFSSNFDHNQFHYQD